MDMKTAKRVDGIYRNIKQLPLLGYLGFAIPIIGIMLLPLVIAYSSLRSRLLRDYDSGLLVIEDHDRVASKRGELATEQKLLFLKDGGTRLFVPYVVGAFWIFLVVCILIVIAVNR